MSEEDMIETMMAEQRDREDLERDMHSFLALATPELGGTCYFDRHPAEPMPRRSVILATIRHLLDGRGSLPGPAEPADPLTEAHVAHALAAARANTAFMNRIAERVENDRELLERLAELGKL